MTNLILVGFMGSGKTTIGKLLSEKRGAEFLDIDDLLEKNIELKISDIFARFGEKWFRDQENFALSCVIDGENRVIATGGGIVERDDNRELLKTGGTVIYLKSTPDKLWTRIGKDPARPLATDLNAFMKLFYKRKGLYDEVADIVIEIDGKTPEMIVSEIERLV